MSSELLHRPVLTKEVREWLAVEPGMVVVDGTLGDGGHSELLCDAVGPTGMVIGIDRDPEAIIAAESRLERYADRFRAVHGNFQDIPELVRQITDRPINRVLLDLGWSTTQFMVRGRGFSFLTNEHLDMRFDPTEETETAAELLNKSSKEELVKIFRLYGEEPRAAEIAEAIIDARDRDPITTTQQLANLMSQVAPRVGKKHPATQVFQALRIAVNDELGVLRTALERITDAVAPHARIGVITFHSLEDRIVKQFVTTRADVISITKKPVIPTWEEVRDNPRSRSSKFRIFEKS